MPATLTADGIVIQSLNILTFCNLLQQILQPDVMLILKCLMQGENMTNISNERAINLMQ